MKLLLAITVAAFVAMFIMQMLRERSIWKGELLSNVSYFRKCFYVLVSSRSLGSFRDFRGRLKNISNLP